MAVCDLLLVSIKGVCCLLYVKGCLLFVSVQSVAAVCCLLYVTVIVVVLNGIILSIVCCRS